MSWDRDKVALASQDECLKSRVVRIRGPLYAFSGPELVSFFKNYIVFNLVDGKEWLEGGHCNVVEIYFTSILGQIRQAVECFNGLHVDGTWRQGLFQMWYAPDPCE